MTMDLTDTIAPTSDQLDAVDLLGGPQTFTITGATRGSAEQPVNIQLAEFPRVWRPSKGMRRVLVACWGPDASQYVGRRVTLYCDPDVKFGGDKVGGTRISHLSHIDKPKSVPMLVSRGKSAVVTVQPLKDAPVQSGPTAADVAACTDKATLTAWWKYTALRPLIDARAKELDQPAGYDAEHPPTDDDLFGGAE